MQRYEEMVNVVSLCSDQTQNSWATIFVVLFAVFLTVDVGITGWSLWWSVSGVSAKNAS